MWQFRPVVADVVDVKEARVWNMGRGELCFGVAVHVGQIPRGIQNAEIRIFQMLGQPFGADKCFGVVDEVCHLETCVIKE